MLCSTCGASNPDSASFCALCLTRFPSAPALRAGLVPRMSDGGAVAVPHPALVSLSATEHEWWVRRRAEHMESMTKGIPTPGSTYALVAFDGQIRYARAVWWSASVFTAFAWIAALRVAFVDWGTVAAASSATAWSIALQAMLIGAVGIAAACVCAAFVSGSEAWRATLINAFFWSILAGLATALAVVGGETGVNIVSILAVGIVLITAIMPFSLDRPGLHVPRA